MFSVVIPLYNKNLSIQNTIQSVLDQSFEDFEILVVNDGSTDNSLEIVKAIKDYRIKIIDKQNGGVSSARNIGIKEAKYEWIAFLDADDLWKKNKLELVNSAIVNYHCKTWIITSFKTIFSKRTIDNTYKKSDFLNNIFDDLLNDLKIQTSAVIVNKQLFLHDERLYFREGVNNSEDREVWYKLACLDSSPFYLNVVLSDYIIDQSGNSLTSKNITNSKMHFFTMQERLVDFLNEITDEDSRKLTKYINNLNKKMILHRWATEKVFPEFYKNHLSNLEYKFFRTSVFLPLILKKYFLKFYSIIKFL